MKRIIFSVVVSMMLLCACDSNKDAEKIENNTEKTSETDTTENLKVDKNVGVSTSANMWKGVKDEKTGELKYAYILEDYISFDTKQVDMQTSICIDSHNPDYENVEAIACMAIDGKLISFSMDGEENKVVHNITLGNGKEEKKKLSFMVDNLPKDEKKAWVFMVIPILEEYWHDPDETMVAYYIKDILYTGDGEIIEENDYCSEGYYYGTTKNVYGKSINEISMYSGAVCDYILQDKNGTWNYMSDHAKGKTIVLLFCDGKLYNGFGESYGMIIDKTSDEQVHMPIDISKLAEGMHKMFAGVLMYDNDGKLHKVTKSLAGDVCIGE